MKETLNVFLYVICIVISNLANYPRGPTQRNKPAIKEINAGHSAPVSDTNGKLFGACGLNMLAHAVSALNIRCQLKSRTTLSTDL